MKKLILILVLALLVSCSKNEEKKSASNIDKTKQIDDQLLTAPKADSFILRYKFKKNEKLQYRITTNSENNQLIEGDTVISTATQQNVKYLINLLVKEIDSKNDAIINLTIKSIVSDGTVNGEKISYDSKYIFSTQERKIFAQYEAVKNKTFTVKISESGKILEIFNLQKIVDELIDIQQQTGSLTIDQKNSLVNNFRDAALRPLVQQLFRKFPSDPVGVNSVWEEKYYTKFAMFDVENVASYQVKNVEVQNNDSLVTISAGLSINWTGNHEATDQGVKYYFYDPVVSGSGLVIFNNSRGLLLHSETSTSMELVIDMEGMDSANNIIKGKRTDNTVNKNIVELVKKSS
ncbi:hypothetical protein MNBD_IGNAVI01-960 [hydrothermal vent metagenome]|uniref:Lipoprotein n=1 Tax=hydrothermal vent metagenome TaxID=652676 RepID=A0A3B1DG43_9ZZZZ